MRNNLKFALTLLVFAVVLSTTSAIGQNLPNCDSLRAIGKVAPCDRSQRVVRPALLPDCGDCNKPVARVIRTARPKTNDTGLRPYTRPRRPQTLNTFANSFAHPQWQLRGVGVGLGNPDYQFYGLGGGLRIRFPNRVFIDADYAFRYLPMPLGGTQTSWTAQLGIQLTGETDDNNQLNLEDTDLHFSLLLQYGAAQEKDRGFYGRKSMSSAGIGGEMFKKLAEDGFWGRFAFTLSATVNVGIMTVYPDNPTEVTFDVEIRDGVSGRIGNNLDTASSEYSLFATVKAGVSLILW